MPAAAPLGSCDILNLVLGPLDLDLLGLQVHLDQLFGVVLAASDEAFNELLALGFLGSMKKEWAWRVSRGESTRNLDAFRHLLEDTPSG